MYSAYSGNNVWVRTKTLTGNYTINGDLTITGNTNLGSTTATTFSASSVTITTTPTNNNTNTQLLSRNPTTGTVEYVDSSSIGSTFNYGLAGAISSGNFLI